MPWFSRSLAVLLGLAHVFPPVEAQVKHELPHRDRARLAEAQRVAGEVRGRVWPGWERTTMRVLLVTDSAEFLVGHPRQPDGFASAGYDTVLKQQVWSRPRRFPPTLLATFPAVDGRPTVVIGTAERTGKSSTAWILTLLHEHFHQWQHSQPDFFTGVAGLGLAGADTTGQWMLDYPFPYDDARIGKAVRRLATALRRAMDAPASARAEAVSAAASARDTLRSSLTPADYRYLEFQLWQEGVARFIEYASAEAASSYAAAAASARRDLASELTRLDLQADRRLAFYPLGAAIALLLDEIRPDWKRTYAERPFVLAALLPATP